MKTLKTVAVAVTILIFFTSCQSASDKAIDLTNKETRNEIMFAIANDSMMSEEMLNAMMNSQNGIMKMQGHHAMMMGDQNGMMKTMQGNPQMMSNMMAAMMESAKGDTTLMSRMISTMIQNHQMRGMMQHMTGDESTNGMHMKGMENE
jgi:hypothetical protein